MVKLSLTVLSGMTLLAMASCTILPNHHHHHHDILTKKKEKITQAAHAIHEKKHKKWDWLTSWRKGDDEHVGYEEVKYPVWKIHKYKGIEIKPVTVIDAPHSIYHQTYPPTNVHIQPHEIHHASPIHWEKPHAVATTYHEAPSPVYVPELESSPWKPSTSGWKWNLPFTQEHHTIHVQEPAKWKSHKKVLQSTFKKPLKTKWIGSNSKYDQSLPTVGASISVHQIPESPEIHYPGIDEIYIPEISHIPMAIPIHQTTTTVVEHSVPVKGELSKYEPYEDENYHHHENHQVYGDKEDKPQQYNSYGDALPPHAYESNKVEIFVPPPPKTSEDNEKVIDEEQPIKHNKKELRGDMADDLYTDDEESHAPLNPR